MSALMMMNVLVLVTTLLVAVDAFAISPLPTITSTTSSSSSARTGMVVSMSTSATTDTDDLLKPSYEIEPLSVRIGHGFDIHRMAPIGDAGQPIVIAGVEITHSDQKVRCGYKNGEWNE